MNNHKAIFKDFSIKIKSEFNADVSVYSYRKAKKKIARFLGGNIQHEVIKHYCCFSTTAILNSPEGLPQAPDCMSRLVTRVFAGSTVFVVVLSAVALEAFKGENGKRVLQMLQEVQLESSPKPVKTPKPVKLRQPHKPIPKLPIIISGIALLIIAAGITGFALLSDRVLTADKPLTASESPTTTVTTSTTIKPTLTTIPTPPSSATATKLSQEKTTKSQSPKPATQPHLTTNTSGPATAIPQTTTSRPPKTTSIKTTTTKRISVPTQPPSPPAVPSSLRIATSSGNIELSWGAVNKADGYEVSRSVSMVSGYSIINAITIRDGARAKITDSNINRGTTYYYSVRAFRTVNGTRVYSEHSEIVSATAQ